MWILLGIVLISLFTGLITAALSVSATPVFKVNGAKVKSKQFDIKVDSQLIANVEQTHVKIKY